ncbi:MAG: alcohol dehydrogenase catalytic domain-containing protein [Chloroflexota bacterium]|nr:alcohol dehydrogenase catalytic domain-containing protein [Chloroflexota bacterium]
MRALVYANNSLKLERNYPNPTLMEGEALVRVLRVGICNTDLEITRGYMDFQSVLGHEFVGVVEDVRVRSGMQQAMGMLNQRVVGEINAACHRADCMYCQQNMFTHCPNRTTLGIVNRDGAFAEYLTLPVENLHRVPENVSDEEAVFVEPLAANFEILEQVHVKPTERVVVLGDGKMGQLAMQVLALSGCEVTMVGKHKEKLVLAEQRGIETCLLDEVDGMLRDGKGRVDMVVECTGSAEGLALALRLVRPRGTVILKSTVANMSKLYLAPIVIDEIRVQGSRCGPFAPALRALSQHRVDVRSLISAQFDLDNGLGAFEKAGKRGVLKVIVKV